MTELNTLSEASPLLIEQFELGPMANYIYFIGDKETKEIVVVDPAWDVNFIRNKAQEAGLTIKGALITHGHPDHTNGINKLLETHDIPVYVSKEEASFYKPIGEKISNDWSKSNYNILNTDKWKVPMKQPPVCINNNQCNVYPNEYLNYTNLNRWDEKMVSHILC